MKSVKKNMLLVLVAAFSFAGCHAVKNQMKDNVYLKLKDKEIPQLIKQYDAATGAQAKKLEEGINDLFTKLYKRNPDSYRQAAIKKLEDNWIKVRAQNRSAMGRALPPLPAQPAAPAGRAQQPLPPLPAQPAGRLYPQLPPRPAQPAGPQATTTTGASAGAAAKVLAAAEEEADSDEIVQDAEPLPDAEPLYESEDSTMPARAPRENRPLSFDELKNKVNASIDTLDEYAQELKDISNAAAMKFQLDKFLTETSNLLNLINDKVLLDELAALKKKIAAGETWSTWLSSLVATPEPKINRDWKDTKEFMVKAKKSARGFLKNQGE